MFGGSKRHRPPPPLTTATANPNASTAASSAFMSASGAKPNQSLSSAAAAAALKARPITPTNVSEVQTKRTLSRSGSVSSLGSARQSRGRASPASTTRLERRASNGSMTDRSFRSPSPHGAPVAAEPDAPPVPELPSDHRGVGMQTFRTASQKMKSKPPSYYGQPSGDTRNVRKSDSVLKKAKPAPAPPQPEPEERVPSRSESRNSVNFSYPISFRGQSPPASPTPAQTPRQPTSPQSSKTSRASSNNTPEPRMVYDANSRRMVPQYSAVTEQRGSGASAKQIKDSSARKKGGIAAKSAAARAGHETKDSKSSDPEWAGTHRKDKGKQNATQSSKQPSSAISRDLDPESEPAGAGESGRPRSKTTIQHQDDYQSMHEDPAHAPVDSDGSDNDLDEEDLEAEAHTPLSQKVLDALDAVPTRQTVYDHPEAAPETPKPASRPDSQVISELSADSDTQCLPNKVVASISAGSTPRRSDSISPGRQTRFASSPAESLTVKHSPLPRSASPIKSAMKRGGISSRDVSPSDGGSHTTGVRDTSPNVGPVPVMPRKKSVRVSFDDRSTMIVGESAPEQDVDSPVVPSPQQAKKPWYSNIGRSKKKDVPLDDDEIMKPRPALPSFGSIRAKKSREPEERPLVRPFEPATSDVSSPAAGPDTTNSAGDSSLAWSEEPSTGDADDLPIGSSSAQMSASRNGNAANISRFREPLPPVVTSVEGTGYHSDPMTSTDSDDLFDSMLEDSDVDVESSTQATLPAAQDNSQDALPMVEDKVLVTPEEQRKKPEPLHESLPHDGPDITITQPSPRIFETPNTNPNEPTVAAPVQSIFDIPGGFPIDEPNHDDEKPKPIVNSSTSAATSRSAESAVTEPPPAIQPGQQQSLPNTTLVTTSSAHDADADSATGSDGSIYSDAYEDQSDMDGDGFMSLDAVVENPVSQPNLPTLAELPGETSRSPRPEGDEVDEVPAAVASKITATPGPPQTDADWEQAKVFWRSLSADKRRQLEQEAIEEAGEEGDREDVSLPTRRPSKKRRSIDQKQLNAVSSPPTSKAKAGQEMTYNSRGNKNPGDQAGQSNPTRMRASMRQPQPSRASATEAATGTGMRKTMRSSREPQHGGQPANGAARSSRSDANTATASRTHSTQIGTGTGASSNAAGSALAKALESSRPRRGSDASDSSFQRARPNSSGGHAFRRSMRPTSSAGPPSSNTDAAKGSGRFSLRSLSPSGSAFRRNSIVSEPDLPPPGAMRRTMRSARSGSFTSQESKRTSMHLGFSRSRAPKSSQPKKSNRFADSSDEDEGGPSLFRSRFNASSDEEDDPQQGSSTSGRPLAKGTLRASTSLPSQRKRTTPVPEVDEDSPELPDSDDDDKQGIPPTNQIGANPRAAMIRSNSGTNSVARPSSRSGHGGFSTSVSAPPSPREKRSSFMGSILKRNKRADQAGKIQRTELVDSAARRDTKLERHVDQLRGLRGDQPSPKLQKRGSLKNQDGWPFPELEASQDAARPNSAGNPTRPTMEGRRSTSLGLPDNTYAGNETMLSASANVAQSEAGDVGFGNQRKKKKFGTLRRMFRLDD